MDGWIHGKLDNLKDMSKRSVEDFFKRPWIQCAKMTA